MAYIGSILRHGLTALAGFLVAKGMIEQSLAEAFIAGNLPVLVGLASYLLGQGLSLFKVK